jgi:hypothetical protein
MTTILGGKALSSISCPLNSSKDLFLDGSKLNLFSQLSSNKEWKDMLFQICVFSKFFFFHTINMSMFSIFFIPIWIPFPFDWIEILFNVFELNWIQINLHAMPFNNFIWRKTDFHKVIHFFHQSIITTGNAEQGKVKVRFSSHVNYVGLGELIEHGLQVFWRCSLSSCSCSKHEKKLWFTNSSTTLVIMTTSSL